MSDKDINGASFPSGCVSAAQRRADHLCLEAILLQFGGERIYGDLADVLVEVL